MNIEIKNIKCLSLNSKLEAFNSQKAIVGDFVTIYLHDTSDLINYSYIAGCIVECLLTDIGDDSITVRIDDPNTEHTSYIQTIMFKDIKDFVVRYRGIKFKKYFK